MSMTNAFQLTKITAMRDQKGTLAASFPAVTPNTVKKVDDRMVISRNMCGMNIPIAIDTRKTK